MNSSSIYVSLFFVTTSLVIGQQNTAYAQQVSAAPPANTTKGSVKRPYAYIASAAVWGTNEIKVCWDNPTPGFREAMELVRTAVQETWEAHSGVRFVNWGTCAKKNTGIRITIVDQGNMGPQTRGLGKQMELRDTPQEFSPGGMYLNFTFQNWSREFCSTDANRATCIRSIAIHEFGHALGFAHEQNRKDKLSECKVAPQGPDGDKVIGPYDPDSVMNYCKSIYTAQLKLSDFDIAGVQAVYGK